MRVLVLTNHLARFGGSEIVALEVAHWFGERGDEVTLAANYINAPINAHVHGLTLTTDVAALDLQSFDIVWCQHDLLTVMPPSVFEQASRSRTPYIVLVSLSPYELYEHVDAWLARALSADVLVNSNETRLEQLRRGHGELPSARVRTFHNAAPAAFWRASTRSAPTMLQTLTLISNHPPAELTQALLEVERDGIEVRRIGFEYGWRLVRPEDFADTDAVVTIGKSAPYAIASGRPVYMYDQFGGDGWLTCANFRRNFEHNFSGRPLKRRLRSDAIAEELKNGFLSAAQGARQLWQVVDLRLLMLDHQLGGLRERAVRGRSTLRALNLRRYLLQPKFRAHLETLHAKSSIMRRSFIAAQGGVQ